MAEELIDVNLLSEYLTTKEEILQGDTKTIANNIVMINCELYAYAKGGETSSHIELRSIDDTILDSAEIFNYPHGPLVVRRMENEKLYLFVGTSFQGPGGARYIDILIIDEVNKTVTPYKTILLNGVNSNSFININHYSSDKDTMYLTMLDPGPPSYNAKIIKYDFRTESQVTKWYYSGMFSGSDINRGSAFDFNNNTLTLCSKTGIMVFDLDTQQLISSHSIHDLLIPTYGSIFVVTDAKITGTGSSIFYLEIEKGYGYSDIFSVVIVDGVAEVLGYFRKDIAADIIRELPNVNLTVNSFQAEIGVMETFGHLSIVGMKISHLYNPGYESNVYAMFIVNKYTLRPLSLINEVLDGRRDIQISGMDCDNVFLVEEYLMPHPSAGYTIRTQATSKYGYKINLDILNDCNYLKIIDSVRKGFLSDGNIQYGKTTQLDGSAMDPENCGRAINPKKVVKADVCIGLS